MSSEIGESGKHVVEKLREHCEAEAGTAEEEFPKSKIIAIASMIMALLSAIGALLAGITANEILIERTEEIVERQDMETARLKVEILQTKAALLNAMDKPVPEGDVKRIEEYRAAIGEVKFEVETDEAKVSQSILEHELFAIGVTILSVAITLCGLSVLTRRHSLFTCGIAISVVGAGFLGGGVYTMFW